MTTDTLWLKWIDEPVEIVDKNKYPVCEYRQCEFYPPSTHNGPSIILRVGDFVRLNTADVGDVARIKSLYDNPNKKDRNRASVDWYTPFSTVLHNRPDDVDDNELFLDTRYAGDIDLCSIIERTTVSSKPCPNALLCRYKIQLKNHLNVRRNLRFVPYTIEPYQIQINDEKTPKKCNGLTRSVGKRNVSIKLNSIPEDANGNSESAISSDTDESPSKKTKKAVDVALTKWNPNVVLTNLNESFVEMSLSGATMAKDNARILRDINEDVNKATQMVSPLKIVKNENQWQAIRTPKSKLIESENKFSDKQSMTTPKRQLFNNVVVPPSSDDENSNLVPQRRIMRTRSQYVSNEVMNIDGFSTPKKSHLTSVLNGTPKGILKTPGSQKLGTPKRRAIISEEIIELTISPLSPDERPTSRRCSGRAGSNKNLAETSDDDDGDFVPSTPKSSVKGRLSRATPTKNQITTPKKAAPKKTAPTTPRCARKTPVHRLSNVTPNIGTRVSAVDERTLDIQVARGRLQVSEVPTSLPCRENEFNAIQSFVEGKIVDQSGGCIYISGVPGTGKTATVTAAVRSLQLKAQRREIPPFEYVELNAMQLTEPRRAYVHIYRELTGKTIPWEEARSLLEHRFCMAAGKKRTTVLLVDELDILCNRRQDVVYNILDWPTKKSAQLVVVTIANTMDLPERVLIGKVASRLGLTRLTFQPYSYKQLQEVIACRLMGTNSYKSEAIQLVSRKVASVSGDCRRALDICRRAGEIAEEKVVDPKVALVTMAHVQQALDEMIASPTIRAIQHCSELEKIFLRAVVAEVTRTGIEEVSFLGVYTQMESIASLFNIKMLPPGQTLAISCGLGDLRLIICEHSRADIYQKICLNVNVDDVHYALNKMNS